jgi:hypothetical protein
MHYPQFAQDQVPIRTAYPHPGQERLFVPGNSSGRLDA